jgi:hypothetical protein
MSKTIARSNIPRRPGDEDGELFFNSFSASVLGQNYMLTASFRRHLPSMQVLTVPQPPYAFSGESRVLPQDVRVMRRPYLLAGSRTMSGCWMQSYIAKTAVQKADIRGYTCGERGGYQETCCKSVCYTALRFGYTFYK